MKPILKDNDADVKMIGMVVGLLVTIIISILIFYNIAASVDTTTIDTNFGVGNNETPAANASDNILSQSATFFSIAPIIAIVVVAVVILAYVSRI